MFFIPGLKTVYMGGSLHLRMFLPGTICKVSISSWQSGTECLYDKNCPALAGIPAGMG